jgi:hypothetical protein
MSRLFGSSAPIYQDSRAFPAAAIFDRRMGLDKKHNEALTMQVPDYLENRTKP